MRNTVSVSGPRIPSRHHVRAQETVLYSFTGGSDGGVPYAGLVFDSSGNLYGTTKFGGVSGGCSGFGCGVIFELSPSGSSWTETVLYSFTGGSDGAYPVAGLIFDAAGNLYGAASAGGNSTSGCVYEHINGCGAVFELSPASGDAWTEAVIHTFTDGSDGAAPVAGLIFDSAGDLYSTAEFGGADNHGVVFEMKKGSTGVWRFSAIHSFTGTDGGLPETSLTFDAAGNLYGTAAIDGADSSGVTFKMKRGSSGSWTLTVLHAFTGGHDGHQPLGGVLIDTAGNVYGTTEGGGKLSECFDDGCGVVYKLTPHTSGYAETVLHTFLSNGTDGTNPFGNLIFDSAGNLYGTTNAGGLNGAGTVYEVTP